MQAKGHWWKNLCQTPWGLLYGDSADFDVNCDQSRKRGHKKPTNLEKLKDDLFSKLKKKTESYMAKLNPVSEFSIESISVQIDKGASVEGIFTCNFCKTDSLVNKVKLYFDQSNGRANWVISNFSRHFKNHHQKDASSKSCSGKGVSTAQHKPNRSLELDIELDTRKEEIVEVEEMIEEDVIDCTEIEDFLYKQMSLQNIHLVNSTLLNEEDVIDFYVGLDLDDSTSSNCKQIKVCRIDGDGNCLYGSLIHQLTFCEIGTAAHKKQTRLLRQECVSFIEKNFEKYLPFLKSRVIEKYEKLDQIFNEKSCDMKKECETILKSLSLNGTYGGVETIKAFSEIKKVNVITINEDGTCNFVHTLDTKYNRSLFVAFRNGNHYDSIAEIDTETMGAFANQLARSHIEISNEVEHPIIV